MSVESLGVTSPLDALTFEVLRSTRVPNHRSCGPFGIAKLCPKSCPTPRNRLSPNVTECAIGQMESAENTDE